jgi:hypothetical protein
MRTPFAALWQQASSAAHAVSTPTATSAATDGTCWRRASPISSGLSRDGWLNRVLQHLLDASTQTAYAIGRDRITVLGGPRGSALVAGTDLALSPQAIKLNRGSDNARTIRCSVATFRPWPSPDGDGDGVALTDARRRRHARGE